MEFIEHENDWWWGHSTVFISTDGKWTVDLSVNKEYPKHGCVRCLMVHESIRQHGVGTWIMKMVEEKAKAKGLEFLFLDANKTLFVKDWYERLGYEVTGENEESGGLTVQMQKDISV